jgi:hypothetical protein
MNKAPRLGTPSRQRPGRRVLKDSLGSLEWKPPQEVKQGSKKSKCSFAKEDLGQQFIDLSMQNEYQEGRAEARRAQKRLQQPSRLLD